MAVTLWTAHFIRICIANLLLFVSLYVLFPVLSVEMADRLGVPVAQTGVIFLFFTLGMFLIGPFHAYLVDAYKRKHVYIYAFALMVVAAVGYAFVTNLTELILLSTVQGLAFGVATTAGITLAIDITNSTLRSAGNVSFSWVARLGMILGIVLGVWLYQSYPIRNLLYVSVIAGVLGILVVSGIYVPFRAPIVTRLYSFDRFLLLRSWIPAINMIMVSRTHPGLLKRLFELEVPEIHDGLVEIKSVAREPGMRSKISVYTKDENIDPVGACVGHKGMRVQTIVNELRGEKIDIVKYSSEPDQYVANALSPAKVVSTEVLEEEKICRVIVPDYQLSLAIGKEGQNARLAAKLTGWKIDIKSESQAAEEAEQGAQEVGVAYEADED